MGKIIAIGIIGMILVGSAVYYFSQNQPNTSTPITKTTETTMPKKTQSKKIATEKSPPAMQIDPNKTYTAVLHTDKGDITIELNAKDTPITVNNFVSLAKDKFYDGTIFHRVIKGFMIQGGDPNGDGTGGPGYRFDDEDFDGEYEKGTIAMANAGPNTNGSQFFIMHEDYALPKNYVIFGKVKDGLDVVDAIAESETEGNPNSGENSTPVDPVTIESVTIQE